MLRRALVFGDALWFTVWARGCDTIKAEWPLGPSLPTIAGRLLDPVFGLPGDVFRVSYVCEDYLCITDDHGPRCARHPRSGPARLVLCPSHGPDGGFNAHYLTTGWHDAGQPWSAWDKVFSAPNPKYPAQLRPQLS
ncbi:MAG: hypothetical protein JOZ47_11365 [Kutzneria sp.]|nr:hypothetical protein [Kutzneria sp.]